MPGVEVHAHIISNILNKDSITKNLVSTAIENFLLILMLIILVLIPIKVKPKFSIIFFIGSLFFLNLIEGNSFLSKFLSRYFVCLY